MKILLQILCFSILVGCHSTKSTVKSTVINDKITETKIAESNELKVVLDTTKVTNKKVTYTKTVFNDPKPDPTTIGKYSPPTIQSVETLVVEENTEKSGITEIDHSHNKYSASIIVDKSKIETMTIEEPSKDPKRFKYIFLICILVVGLLIYFRNSPIIQVPWQILKKLLVK